MFINHIILLISGIVAPGTCGVAGFTNIVIFICKKVNIEATTVNTIFPVPSKSIPSHIVFIPSRVRYPLPNEVKKLYSHSAGTVSAATCLTTKNNPINTGIWISILKHHFNGPAPSFFNIFIVSSDNFFGSSLYFSCASCILGCNHHIDCCICAPARLGLIRRSLTTIVIQIIARPKFPANNPRNITMMLNTGRYNTSETISINGFMKYIITKDYNNSPLTIHNW